MGSCLSNFLLVRVKLLIRWDFCRFFKVLLEQLLEFLLIISGPDLIISGKEIIKSGPEIIMS